MDLKIQWHTYSAYLENKNRQKSLSDEEREGAHAGILRILQQEQFAEEMKSLRTAKEILKNSKILQFSPFIDQQGLIRAQGRIDKSQLNFETKHPILLHCKHHVVELFLQNEHKNSHHEGTEHVRNIVQEQFWILDIRNALRSIKTNVLEVEREEPKQVHQ